METLEEIIEDCKKLQKEIYEMDIMLNLILTNLINLKNENDL